MKILNFTKQNLCGFFSTSNFYSTSFFQLISFLSFHDAHIFSVLQQMFIWKAQPADKNKSQLSRIHGEYTGMEALVQMSLFQGLARLLILRLRHPPPFLLTDPNRLCPGSQLNTIVQNLRFGIQPPQAKKEKTDKEENS